MVPHGTYGKTGEIDRIDLEIGGNTNFLVLISDQMTSFGADGQWTYWAAGSTNKDRPWVRNDPGKGHNSFHAESPQ